MELSPRERKKRFGPSLQDLADLAGVPLEIVRDIELDVQEVSAEHVNRINQILLCESESAELVPQAHRHDVGIFPKKRMTTAKKKNRLKLPSLPWKHTAKGKNASLEIADKYGEPIFDSSRPYDEEIKATKFIIHAANAIFALAKKDRKDPLEVAIALEMRTRNVDREEVLKYTDLRKRREYSRWPMGPKNEKKKIYTIKEIGPRKENVRSATSECPHRAFEGPSKPRCFDPHFKEYLTPQKEWLRQWCLSDFRNCPIFLGLDTRPPRQSNSFEN